MAQTTITEALAEIPTIEKRIEKKSEFILNYLYRQSAVRDPHEKDGGSSTLIHRELQAIHDLQERIIKIRSAIQKANAENTITILKETKSIVDWLTWRREVAPEQQSFLKEMTSKINAMRQQAIRQGVGVTDNGWFLVGLSSTSMNASWPKKLKIWRTFKGLLNPSKHPKKS